MPEVSSTKQKEKQRRPTRRQVVRWAIRFTSLAVAAVLVMANTVPGISLPLGTPQLASFSPFIAVNSAIALRTVSATILLAVPIVVLSLLGRRFFCRYFCPMGVLLDCAGCTRHGRRVLKRLPRLGLHILFVTGVLALLGGPMFLWLDPLSIFSALLGHGPYHWLALPGVCLIVMSVILPKIWCMKVCPLGAMQDLIRLPIYGLWLLFSDSKNLEAVIGPDPPKSHEPEDVLARRDFFRFLGTVGFIVTYAGFMTIVSQRRSRRPKPELKPEHLKLPELFRPPGAIAGQQFELLCTRCGSCMAVCPTRLLTPGYDAENRLFELGTPHAEFDPAYCRDDCNLCTQVCPSGAIQPLTLDEKRDFRIGTARIELDLCLLTFNRECQICKRDCPRDAITFRWNDDTYTMTPEIDPEQCNGCGACVIHCPGMNSWELEADPTTAERKAIRIGAV